jgi:hypothetical protein
MRLWLILAAVSQVLNALLGGSPDQTLSARALMNQRRRRWQVTYRALNALFFWQDDHCLRSFLADERNAHEYLEQIALWRLNNGE